MRKIDGRFVRLVAHVALAAWLVGVPRAMAEDARACWAGFVRDAGVTEEVGEIVTFRFVRRTFHVPVNYLWRSRPGAEVHEDRGVWILAWPPNFAPSTAEHLRRFWNSGRSEALRITIFGHAGQLTTEQSLRAMIEGERAVMVEEERNELGYRV